MRCPSCNRSVPDDALNCLWCNAPLKAPPGQPRAPRALGASVLLVDDDALVLTLLAKVLAGAGCAVATADDHDAAVAQLRQRKFDVVLSDLVMPGADGVAVIAEARRLLPDALIVCMSGQADITLAGAALDAGAEQLLVKPFTPQSVVAELGRLLAAKREGKTAGMPPDLAAFLRSRTCPACHGSDLHLSHNWSDWSAPIECANCNRVVFIAGRCRQCGQWGIQGETYTEAFGLCQRCATAITAS